MDSQYLAQAIQQMQAMGQTPQAYADPQQQQAQAGRDRKTMAEVLKGAGGAIAGAPQALMQAPKNLAGIFSLGDALGRR